MAGLSTEIVTGLCIPLSIWNTALPGEWDRIAALGATDVRCDAEWASSELTMGVYTWTKMDAIYNAATSRGLRVHWTLAYGNPLYTAQPGGGDKYPPKTLQALAAYAAWCAAVVNRYSPRSVGMWNEQDDPRADLGFFKGGTVGDYVNLLQAAVPAIRAARPATIVVMGGVTNDRGPAWMDAFCALGGLDLVDAVDIHPYYFSGDAEVAGLIVRNLRRILCAYPGGATKPMWATETGSIEAAICPDLETLEWTSGAANLLGSQSIDVQGGLWTTNDNQALVPSVVVASPVAGATARRFTPVDGRFSGVRWNGGGLVEGAYYSVSVWVRAPAPCRMMLGPATSPFVGVALSTKWTRKSFTVKAESGNLNRGFLLAPSDLFTDQYVTGGLPFEVAAPMVRRLDLTDAQYSAAQKAQLPARNAALMEAMRREGVRTCFAYAWRDFGSDNGNYGYALADGSPKPGAIGAGRLVAPRPARRLG